MNPLTLPAPDRFALILDALCAAVAARLSARTMTPAFIVLIWKRVRRFRLRFQALVAAIRSGTLPVERVRAAATRRTTPRPRGFRWPRQFAWLLPLVPSQAACYASQLRVVLADPEMAALIAATPRMVRALRPLCHMLGIEASLLSRPADTAAAVGDRDPSPDGTTPDVTTARVAPQPVPAALPIGGFPDNPVVAIVEHSSAECSRPLVPT